MKNIVNIVVFLAMGIAILHGLASIAKSIDPEGTADFLRIDQDNIARLLDHSDTAEAIVLGNSHGDDIDFTGMGYEGYSLARAWGDLFEIQYYLHYLVPRLPRLKVVFLPISYFTLDWDNALVNKLAIRRMHMYTAIPSWKVVPWDYKNYFIGRGTQLLPFQTILRQDNWQGIFSSQFFGGSNNNGSPILIDECEYMDINQLTTISKTRAREQIQFTKEIHNAQPAIRENTYQAIVDIIQYLHRNDIRVVLFTPPYYEEYKKYYLQNNFDGIRHMKEVMTQLNLDYGITHNDFSQDERFVSNFTLFKDADHLNRCGKQMFSQILHESLDENGSVP